MEWKIPLARGGTERRLVEEGTLEGSTVGMMKMMIITRIITEAQGVIAVCQVGFVSHAAG